MLKKIIFGIVLELLLICTILQCVILARAGTASVTGISTVKVIPASITVEPGFLFTVNVTITGAPTMNAWIIDNITWDPAIIELQTGTDADFVEGPFMKRFGTTIFGAGGITPGRVEEIICALFSGSASGDGLLFTIKFRAKAVGVNLIQIGFAVLAIDLDIVDYPDLQNGTVIVVIKLPIYIRADGSVDPSTAPIQRNGDSYTLTNNITFPYLRIVVERNNMTLEGAGYTVQVAELGIDLTGRSNVTIRNTKIKPMGNGILLDRSSNNSIVGNIIEASGNGISLNNSSNSNSISGNRISSSNNGIIIAYSSDNNSVLNNNIIANIASGIYISECTRNKVYENNITNNKHGIELHNSSNNSIDGNNVTNNRLGIKLSESSNNSISGNKITANGGGGIIFQYSSRNSISGNNITNSGGWGVYLLYSSNNTLSGNNIANHFGGIMLHVSSNSTLVGNNMSNNYSNFCVLAEKLSEYANEVDTSNTINGKPIYYWINKQNMTIPLDAGYVALVNCTRMTVHNLNLTRNGQGILLAYTTNTTITKNNVTNNFEFGIYIQDSSNNSVYGNNISHSEDGIELWNSSNNSISGNNIATNTYGIALARCSLSNSISGNNITNNNYGIRLSSTSPNNSISGNNSISRNNIANNWEDGIYTSSSGNSISENNITANKGYGIHLARSSNNVIYRNNFVNNAGQVSVYKSFNNTWDDGYPSGGNYWSDYTGVDSDHDGIGDSKYFIDEDNTDHYPLMGMFSSFNATSEYNVQTICNSTISNFQFNGTAISFNVSGENATIGFCRICIPTALMNDTYRVFINGTEILPPPLPLPCSNNTHTYLYFNYTLSTKEIVIVPEFSSAIALLLVMVLTTIAVIIRKKRLLRKV